MKCTLCGNPNARMVKYETGHVLFQCADCMELGVQAHLERTLNNEEMDLLKPETFKSRPACSTIWLLACNMADMPCH